jgi:ABC-type dipeptide/oligopeptide/nickel transport system permease subunit
LLTRVTGGLIVVISTGEGIVSGYLISHAKRMKMQNTEMIIAVPHLVILPGGLPIISLTGSE